MSSAFKNENVYKIVLPRSRISYQNVREVIEDNFAVYSRIQAFKYTRNHPYNCRLRGAVSQMSYISDIYFKFCKDSSFILHGNIEFYSKSRSGPESEKNYLNIYKNASECIKSQTRTY